MGEFLSYFLNRWKVLYTEKKNPDFYNDKENNT